MHRRRCELLTPATVTCPLDRDGFLGLIDLLNGPGRWTSLDALTLTQRSNWRNRIRSIRVG